MRYNRLPENWSRHISPTGLVYYYNKVTKESTYDKTRLSVSDAARVSANSNKESDSKHEMKVIFKIPLPNSIYDICFTNNGSHFYYERTSNRSFWRLDDEVVQDEIDRFDKNTLIWLTAKARGLKLDENIENQLKPLFRSSHEEKEENKIETLTEDQLSESPQLSEQQKEGEIRSSTLVGGYSSSDEEDSDNDEKDDEFEVTKNGSKVEEQNLPTSLGDISLEAKIGHLGDENLSLIDKNKGVISLNLSDSESSEEENALDLAELDSDEDEGGDQEGHSSTSPKIKFIALLNSFDLNPYNMWEIESMKIINEPEFFEIDNNKERKEIFDTWCKVTIANGYGENRKSGHGTNTNDNGSDNDDDKIEYDKSIMRFFAYLEKKKGLSQALPLFKDFLDDNEEVLTEFEGVTAREIEIKYKEYLMYSKKSEEDNIRIFTNFIKGAKIFRRNVIKNKNEINFEHFQTNNGNEDDASSKKLLKELEHKIEISESLISNTKYHIISPALKLKLLVDLIKQIV
ncbi:hypothetical protein WICMUC_003944 [Wickerhamomyces mucosus]|uniref:WW domain-containing protein n=1 Tax=Wickerhamomyces mucosus TaxID=1378264 RepID=A0A9P8TBG7_9ASCO|nr:hypothetical protein WICMUC_003944 [Wickerhamomyces mucosus]